MSDINEKFEKLEERTKEDPRYRPLIIGKIRRWWDKKTVEEQMDVVYGFANAVMAATLIVGTAYCTKRSIELANQTRKELHARENARFSDANIQFKVNSETNKAQLRMVRIDPNTGDIQTKALMTGDLEAFNGTAKAFTDASSYIKSKSAENEYARIVYDQSGLHKYHKSI